MMRLGRRWCRILGVAPDQPAPKADPSEATARVEDASKAEFAPPPPFPPGAAEAREGENKARRAAGDASARVFARDPGDASGGTTGTSREPTPDEQAAARRLARALREASAGGRDQTVITSATPPGRLRMRHAMAADAQRAARAMPTAKPFTRVKRRRVPAPPLAVGAACDVSGSMSGFTGPVASTAWILARATASLPAARTATVTYGRDVRPVTYPGAVPAQVAEFSAAGKYEDFTRAVSALDGALGLSRPVPRASWSSSPTAGTRAPSTPTGKSSSPAWPPRAAWSSGSPPATPPAPWPAQGRSSSPTPPPPARRSPARSPPAPAPPDRPPREAAQPASRHERSRRRKATRAPDRGSKINTAGKKRRPTRKSRGTKA